MLHLSPSSVFILIFIVLILFLIAPVGLAHHLGFKTFDTNLESKSKSKKSRSKNYSFFSTVHRTKLRGTCNFHRDCPAQSTVTFLMTPQLCVYLTFLLCILLLSVYPTFTESLMTTDFVINEGCVLQTLPENKVGLITHSNASKEPSLSSTLTSSSEFSFDSDCSLSNVRKTLRVLQVVSRTLVVFFGGLGILAQVHTYFYPRGD